MANSIAYTIPVPIGGINDRDDINSMPETDAIRLLNIFPDQGVVKLRNGYRVHATGLGGSVQTLLEYSTAAGTRQLIAAANGKLWNATTYNSAATQIGTGFSVNYWQHVVFNNTLIMVNGTDQPQQWDGTTLSDAVYTGVTDNNLISVGVYKSRLYFVEKDTTKVWYGGVDNITGALTSLNVGGSLKKGGFVTWCGSMTRDLGSGTQDLLVIATNLGEILTYSGSYPGDTAFALTGHYFFPLILGRRAFANIGTDLAVITQDGIIPLSEALKDDQAGENYTNITDKIRIGFRNAALMYKSNTGWEIRNYPFGGFLLVNIPTASNSTSYQYVLNTRTGAWTKFTGWNGICWSLLNESLYFGASDGKIYQADYGSADNSNGIPIEIKTAFNYCGDKSHIKHFTMAAPSVIGDTSTQFYMDVDVDGSDKSISSSVLTQNTSGTPWGSPWGSPWSSGGSYTSNWYAISGLGRAGALRVQGVFKNAPFSMSAIPIIYSPGGYI